MAIAHSRAERSTRRYAGVLRFTHLKRSITMKSASFATGAVLLALLIGLALGAALVGNPAVAQSGSTPAAGRYQVSAYGAPTGENYRFGCYVLDTATGELWHTAQGGAS